MSSDLTPWDLAMDAIEDRGCDCDGDPDDPRLLPDGSRLVDALALSLVGRHLLAGGGR